MDSLTTEGTEKARRCVKEVKSCAGSSTAKTMPSAGRQARRFMEDSLWSSEILCGSLCNSLLLSAYAEAPTGQAFGKGLTTEGTEVLHQCG